MAEGFVRRIGANMVKHNVNMLIRLEKDKHVTYELMPLWETHTMSEQHADITVGIGQTLNTGNFTSVRVDVSLRYPSDIDNIDSTYELVYNWVGDKLAKVINDVQATYAGSHVIHSGNKGNAPGNIS